VTKLAKLETPVSVHSRGRQGTRTRRVAATGPEHESGVQSERHESVGMIQWYVHGFTL